MRKISAAEIEIPGLGVTVWQALTPEAGKELYDNGKGIPRGRILAPSEAKALVVAKANGWGPLDILALMQMKLDVDGYITGAGPKDMRVVSKDGKGTPAPARLVVQKTRVVNIRADKYDVYVGGKAKGAPKPPYPWANPFVGKTAIAGYRLWLGDQSELLSHLYELRGKTLGTLDDIPSGGVTADNQPYVSHAQVLAEMADGVWGVRPPEKER